jgi:hypothetical protein
VIRVRAPTFTSVLCASKRVSTLSTSGSAKLVGHVVGGKGVAGQSSSTGWFGSTTSGCPAGRENRTTLEERGVDKDIESSGTTTIFVRVSGALASTARVGEKGSVSSSVPENRVTVAFSSKFYTGDRQAFGVAKVDTDGSSHVVIGHCRAEESLDSVVCRFRHTSGPGPASWKRSGGVDEIGVGQVGLVAGDHTGTSVERVVSGKSEDLSSITNVFIDDRVLWLTGVGGSAVEQRSKRRTVLQVSTNTVVDVAFVDSSLKNVGTVD